MKSQTNAVVQALTGRAPWLAHVVAYALFALELVRIAVNKGNSMDNLLVVRAARLLFDGQSPYQSERFLYPPSSVPFALVQAPLSDGTLRVVMPFVFALMMLAGWWAVLRLFDVGLSSWLGVLGVLTSILFNPAVSALALGSWTAPVAGLMGIALLLMGRGRWLAAGVVIGLSIAVKPMLVPIGLIFLLARRWGGFAAAAGVPLAVCAVVLPLLPDPGLFFTKTLPFLLGGQDDYARLYDASLPAILPRLGADGWLVTTARLAVFAVCLAGAVLRWRRGDEERLRLVETSAILMVGTFLIMTPAFYHYPMVVLPALVASVVLDGSLARNLLFWITMVPLTQGFDFLYIDFLNDGHGSQRQPFKVLLWMLTLLALLLYRTVRDRTRPNAARARIPAQARSSENVADARVTT